MIKFVLHIFQLNFSACTLNLEGIIMDIFFHTANTEIFMNSKNLMRRLNIKLVVETDTRA